jgi:hypothetical protein
MRRALIFLIAALVVIPTTAGATTRRQKNRVDHVKYYLTCATCPRIPTDGGLVVCQTRKVEGVTYNRLGDRLYNFWQKGTACYDPPDHFKSMEWHAGSGAANQWWNAWGEDKSRREIHKDGGPGGLAPWRYRRTEFYFEASYKAWTFNEHVWAAQTFRSDGGYTPAHS